MERADLIAVIIIVLLIIFITPRFFIYSPSGDVRIFFKDDLDYNATEDEMVERLYTLAIYPYTHVQWHYTAILSILAAFILLYAVGALNIRNFIIAVLIFFLIIDVPYRTINAHNTSLLANEATQIYGALRHN